MKLHTLTILGLLTCMMVLLSCEKSDITDDIKESSNNEPQYYVRAKIGNEKIDLELGDSVFEGVTFIYPLGDGINVHHFQVSNLYDNTRGYFNIDLSGKPMGSMDLVDDIRNGIRQGPYEYLYSKDGSGLGYASYEAEVACFYNDKWYVTRRLSQNSLFNVLSAKDLVKDGLLYKDVTVTFKCRLSNITDTTDVIELDSGEARIVFGGVTL